MPLTRYAYRLLTNVITSGKGFNILDYKRIERKYEPDILARSYNFIYSVGVGTGDKTFSIDDFNLSEPYKESTRLKVEYNEIEEKYIVTIEAVIDFDETITIKEIGLFGRFRDHKFLVLREVYTDGILVMSGQSMRIKITLQFG